MLCELIYVVVHGIYTGTQYLHRHLACYTWYMIYDTVTRYLQRYSVFTPALGMLHLIYDIWNWYFPCLTHDTRHRYLICHTCHLILTPSIWHMLTLLWYAFMWYKYMDLTSWPLTGHYHPWWHIHDYHFYGDLIIILLPYIWYFWTPVLLNLLAQRPSTLVLMMINSCSYVY